MGPTQVSCIAGSFFTIWAIREGHKEVLLTHTSKVKPQILQARLQQYVNCELPDIQAGLEKAEELESKLTMSVGS